jgi:peptidoglycan/LPS O-acetylase OafA/YrhL
MVLLGHCLYFVGGPNAGIYGVNLFFVLSGFLITGILLRQKENKFSVSYKRFIARRALRIFPVYYLLIFFFITIGVKGVNDDWAYLITYTYNFRVSSAHQPPHYIYGPYWSLSVEEQFYIFFPFIVLLLNKRPKWQITVFFSLIIIAILERKFLLTGIHPYDNIVTNMGALTMGAVGAWTVHYNKLNRKFFNSIIVEILFYIALAISFKVRNPLIIFVLFPVINLYLVIKASSFNYRLALIDKILMHKWAIFIGKISYGIYLYHLMIQYFFTEYIFSKIWNTIPFEHFGYFSRLKYNETLIKFPFTISLTILIAYLSFRFIESPFLGLKDKYFKKETIVGKPVIIERSSAL